jgi:hypothetical protein
MPRQPKAPAAVTRGRKPSTEGPTEEEIRQRAYELYAERGETGGSALEDWLRAERELRDRRRRTK